MKKLYFLRHAKSDWSIKGDDGTHLSDIERPLSKRGQNAAKKMQKFLKNYLSIDLIKYSSARRAWQTFTIVEKSISSVRSQQCDMIYTFQKHELLEVIKHTDDGINQLLIIGHNPAIQETILWLTSKQSSRSLYKRVEEKFPTAAFASIDLVVDSWTKIVPSCGILVEFVRPIDL